MLLFLGGKNWVADLGSKVMSTSLETARQTFTDIEQLELSGAKLMVSKANRTLPVSLDQCLSFVAERVYSKAGELEEYFKDSSSLRETEISSLGGSGSVDVWHSFYGSIKKVKDYHSLHTDMPISTRGSDAWMDEASSYATQNANIFTSVESGGRYVDMSFLYIKYINLKRVREHRISEYVQEQWRRHCRTAGSGINSSLKDFSKQKENDYVDPDYISWLREFAVFDGIPRYLKYKQQDYEVCILKFS